MIILLTVGFVPYLTLDAFAQSESTSDTTPPHVKVQSDITLDAGTADSVKLVYDVSAIDDVDGVITPTCDIGSGTIISVKQFASVVVTCTATDSSGNTGSASFLVTIISSSDTTPSDTTTDTTPPDVMVPSDMTIDPELDGLVTLEYDVSAIDDVDGVITPTCDIKSGIEIPILYATEFLVTCTARDSAGNMGGASFMVKITPVAETGNGPINIPLTTPYPNKEIRAGSWSTVMNNYIATTQLSGFDNPELYDMLNMKAQLTFFIDGTELCTVIDTIDFLSAERAETVSFTWTCPVSGTPTSVELVLLGFDMVQPNGDTVKVQYNKDGNPELVPGSIPVVVLQEPVYETPSPVVEQPEIVHETPEHKPYPPPDSTTVVIPGGTDSPGCEETRSCYDPYQITVKNYSTITWINVDSAAHTVTSGIPANGPDGTFDSGMIFAGKLFSYKFDSDGTFNYFCMVHPWMLGQVVVQSNNAETDEEIRIEPVGEVEHEERDDINKKYYDAMKEKRHDALIRMEENPNIPEHIKAMIMEKRDISDDRMDEIKMKYREKHGDLTDEKRTELKMKFKDHMTSMKFTMSDERKSEIHDRIAEMKIFKAELRERASEMTDEEKQGLRAEFIEKAKDMRLAWISPRAQMHAGISTDEIECREGFSLVMKESNGKAMCLKADTALRMIDRGIAVPA